jgi:hypothetical protein
MTTTPGEPVSDMDIDTTGILNESVDPGDADAPQPDGADDDTGA